LFIQTVWHAHGGVNLLHIRITKPLVRLCGEVTAGINLLVHRVSDLIHPNIALDPILLPAAIGPNINQASTGVTTATGHPKEARAQHHNRQYSTLLSHNKTSTC